METSLRPDPRSQSLTYARYLRLLKYQSCYRKPILDGVKAPSYSILSIFHPRKRLVPPLFLLFLCSVMVHPLGSISLKYRVQRAYESDLLFVIVLGLSKCCTVVLYQHLSSRVFHSMTYGMLGATVIWTLTSLLLLAIRCSHDPWEDIDHRCGGLVRALLRQSRVVLN
jgi:hypothetical protein